VIVGEPSLGPAAGVAGLALASAGAALVPLASAAVRRVFPGRNVVFVRWGFSHVALVLALLLLLFWASGPVFPAGRVLERHAAVLGGGCLLVALFARRLDPEGLRCLGLWRGGQARALLAGFAAYVLLAPLLLGVFLAWPAFLEWTGHENRPQPIVELLRAIPAEGRPVAVLLGVAVLPLLEELLFRAFLQPLLVQNLSDRLGILATSFVFAALHGASAFLPILALSLVLGGVMLRTQRLLAVWAVHGLHNGLMFLALYSGYAPQPA